MNVLLLYHRSTASALKSGEGHCYKACVCKHMRRMLVGGEGAITKIPEPFIGIDAQVCELHCLRCTHVKFVSCEIDNYRRTYFYPFLVHRVFGASGVRNNPQRYIIGSRRSIYVRRICLVAGGAISEIPKPGSHTVHRQHISNRGKGVW
jgi:hypothetical protein